MTNVEQLKQVPLWDLRTVDLSERYGKDVEVCAPIFAANPHWLCDHRRNICLLTGGYD